MPAVQYGSCDSWGKRICPSQDCNSWPCSGHVQRYSRPHVRKTKKSLTKPDLMKNSLLVLVFCLEASQRCNLLDRFIQSSLHLALRNIFFKFKCVTLRYCNTEFFSLFHWGWSGKQYQVQHTVGEVFRRQLDSFHLLRAVFSALFRRFWLITDHFKIWKQLSAALCNDDKFRPLSDTWTCL